MVILAPVLDRPRAKAPESGPFPNVNLIDRLLADQDRLQTPVADFARAHELQTLPPRTELYRHLIPFEKPGDGEQYAFQVELDKCTSCKACVTACHSLNGLDEGESWRDIGLLDGGEDDPAWKQTVTSACHHCAEPECLHGCPVAAYEKDAETGIVRHLDDQCIGCEYCVLKCFGVEVETIRYRSTGRELVTKFAKKVQKIRTCFSVSANQISDAEIKTIYLQIVDGDGELVLGTDTLITIVSDSSYSCTSLAEFEYNNIEMTHCFEWERVQVLSLGMYQVNLIIEGSIAARTNLKLR